MAMTKSAILRGRCCGSQTLTPIFVTEMMGAVDVLPVASIMLALLLVVKRKHALGAASVAAGIALKLFPLVTIPAILYSSRIAGCRRVKILISALLAVLGLVAYVSWSQFPFSEAYYTQATTEFVSVPKAFTAML